MCKCPPTTHARTSTTEPKQGNVGILPYAYIKGHGVVSAETGEVQAHTDGETRYDEPPAPTSSAGDDVGRGAGGGTDISRRFSAPKRTVHGAVNDGATAPRLSNAALSSVFVDDDDDDDDGFDADATDTTVPTLLAAGL